jgi:Endoribonuclease L-PSP
MTIKRHEPSKIYNAVVEANGFVFLAGITPKTLTKDIKGQTQEVVDEIDRLLKVGGTDKSKIVSATQRHPPSRPYERSLDRLDRRPEPPRSRLRRSQARRSTHAGGNPGDCGEVSRRCRAGLWVRDTVRCLKVPRHAPAQYNFHHRRAAG